MSLGVKKDGLSNLDLINKFKPYKNFGGVVLLKDMKKLDPSHEKFYFLLTKNDGHWNLLWIGKREAYYFDPFSVMGIPRGILTFLEKTGKPIYVNSFAVQGVKTTTCGNWTALVAELLSSGKSFRNIVDKILPSMVGKKLFTGELLKHPRTVKHYGDD
jgi:hypothetical protein